jgi:peptide/nickel transport system substrate-binding protein
MSTSGVRRLAVVLAIAVGVAACGGDDDDGPTTEGTVGEEEYQSGATVRARLVDVWRSFDIQEVVEGNTHNMTRNAYASLLHQRSNGELVPYLAESFDISLTEATFVIRPDVTCSDGTPLTASIVKASFDRLLAGEVSRARIFGPGPYATSADDATRTFTFTTESPFAMLRYAFGDRFPYTQTAIICPSGLAPGADLTKELHGAGGPTGSRPTPRGCPPPSSTGW